MRLPRKAPKLGDLLPTLTPETVARLVEFGPTVNGRYYHWDKLRHLDPPDGLSLKQWWLGLKLARAPSRISIPLEAEPGLKFSFIGHDVVARSLHHIDRHSGHIRTFKPFLGEPATRSRYVISSLTEEAITSSQLEGASTTRVVAKAMLRSGRKPATASEQMIAANYEAMQYAVAQRGKEINTEKILRLHHILAPDERVRSPSDPVHVVHRPTEEIIHTPPSAHVIEASLDALCAFANANDDTDEFLHPVLRSVIIHFWIGFLHPFTDGNGRVARALFYWSMLNQGYWLWEFIPISTILRRAPTKYTRAYCYSESDEGDLTYFILHHLDVMKRALDELERYINRKGREIQRLENLLRRSGNDLNHRQLALLTQALKDPETAFSFKSHQRSHKVAYETARTDLMGLEDLGLLEGFKRKNRRFFRPVSDLEERMEAQFT